MKLSQVELIVEIAKVGSISRAAENLYISQPAVSKLLQRFEEEVGAQIFERRSTGVCLTAVGKRFVDSAQDILQQMERLNSIFDTGGSCVSMELNVAAMSYHFLQRMLPEIYNKYKQNSISINYVECGFDDELELIKKGEVEIGIVSFWQEELKRVVRRTQSNGLEYHRLGDAIPYIGVSRNSKLYPEHVTELDLDRLAQMPLVSLSPSSPVRTSGWDYLQQIFGKNNLSSSNREIRTSSTGTMKEIVGKADGFALVVLNSGIYRRYGFFEDIRLIPIPGEHMQFELGWLQRENTVRSPLANEFISMLKEYVT